MTMKHLDRACAVVFAIAMISIVIAAEIHVGWLGIGLMWWSILTMWVSDALIAWLVEHSRRGRDE